jgi:hypothetical protein
VTRQYPTRPLLGDIPFALWWAYHGAGDEAKARSNKQELGQYVGAYAKPRAPCRRLQSPGRAGVHWRSAGFLRFSSHSSALGDQGRRGDLPLPPSSPANTHWPMPADVIREGSAPRAGALAVGAR